MRECSINLNESFNVKIPGGITLSPSKGLVVYFSRGSYSSAPTAIKVEYPNADGSYETLGYAYLLFRGGETVAAQTHEFSERIYPKTEKTFNEFKLTLVGVSGANTAKFVKFNLFAIGTNESYPAGRKDPMRAANEYSEIFHDFTYKPTRGILDNRNWYGRNEPYYNSTTLPWENKKLNLEFPTFKEQPNLNSNDSTQMPHVIEHTLYAMPGDVISLTPFYDLPTTDRYTEIYSHWYGYNKLANDSILPQTYSHVTDSTGNRLLDFLIDPAGIVRTDNAGFFSGENVPYAAEQYVYTTTEAGTDSCFIIYNYASLNNFAKLVNSGRLPANTNAILAKDLDCVGGPASIGTKEHPYCGNFNGNSYAIRNLGSQLFGYIGNGAEIHNLQVLNAKTTDGSGLLIDRVTNSSTADNAGITIQNIILTGIISNPTDAPKGGVIGEVEKRTVPVTVTIDHVVFVGNVYTTNLGKDEPNGALIGSLNNNLAALNGCFVKANVDGKVDKNNVTITTPSADGIAQADDRGNISGDASCCLNLNRNGHDISIDIGNFYVEGNDHHIIVYNKPFDWDGISVRIRSKSGGSDLIPTRTCTQIPNKNAYYCNFSETEWEKFIYKVVNGVTLLASSDWENVISEKTYNEYKRTPYHSPIDLIPDGYKDFYITNLINSTTNTKSIPIPYFEREAVTFTAFTDRTHPTRWYGTEATFYQPLKTAYPPTAPANLSLEKEEYYIAADFGHEFDANDNNHNIDRTDKKIYEPVLAYRHVFHVKDGKTFADSCTTEKNKNREYIANNAQYLSARAGYDFQVRLTTQVPVENQSNAAVPVKTNFYYKSNENSYERVPYVGIALFDKNGRKIPNVAPNSTDDLFFFDAPVQTQGYRNNYPDSENGFSNSAGQSNAHYYTGNGGGEVYRMLSCKYSNAAAGDYIVRLYAKNASGNPINIYNTSDTLYLNEYHISFIADSLASVKTENELYNETGQKKFYYHSPAYLSKTLGNPAVVINFDEYCQFEDSEVYNLDDWFITRDATSVGALRYVKWPLPWKHSAYSFGYGGHSDYDYNEYIITNHSSQVNFSNGKSFYDRHFIDTEKETKKGKPGYFLYVNAASDPGTVAKLTINDLCPGSTICVSAWVAELSNSTEVANLCFNFVAVDNEGKRKTLHSFVSGYIDNQNLGTSVDRKNMPSSKFQHRSEWMHVFYTFIPDITNIGLSNISHYELELDNNCISSYGADYAVDDIRAYVIAPEIKTQQLTPICDANQKTTGIRISSRFNELLSSVGLERVNTAGEAKNLKLHFAVLDKEKYDSIYTDVVKYPDELTRRKEAVRVSIFDLQKDATTTHWVSANITSHFESLDLYHTPNYDNNERDVYNKEMRFTKDNVDYFFFNILPYDDNGLLPGKELYIVLYEEIEGVTELNNDNYDELFGVTENPCEKYCITTLQGSGKFKIDGYAHSGDEPMEVCEGQSPVIQVQLMMSNNDTETDLPEPYEAYKKAPMHYYDWFRGTLDEFMETRNTDNSEGSTTYSYYNLLNTFRKDNPDAAELPVLAPGETDQYEPLRALGDTLKLHQSTYVFPPIVDPGGDHIITVTALPILPLLPVTVDNIVYSLCSQPNELKLHVMDSAPRMYNGFDVSGIDYGDITNVPLRLGYTQLSSVAYIDDLKNPTIEKYLELPLRKVTSYKGPSHSAVMIEATKTFEDSTDTEPDPFVYLINTNDPAYIGVNKHPMDKVAVDGLLPIGMIKDIKASSDDNGNNVNKVSVIFSKKMEFSEGYYYTLRFNYDESGVDDENYCQGQVVFTLKVVPAYMKWTGKKSRNWNNDTNWTRVTKKELMVPNGNTTLNGQGKVSDHTVVDVKSIRYDLERKDTVWVRDTSLSYAPLNFTRVIIPNISTQLENDSAKGYPVMFTPDHKSLFGDYSWDYNPNSTNTKVGEATKNIEFDMTSVDSSTKLACRPWYANTCKEIHFRPGSELLDQQHFIFDKNYEKAWVDMEFTGKLWHLKASPLKYTVAGDMYTKPDSLYQDTELFSDINFNPTDYGRYKLPVYQRGWNKASAKLYTLGGDHNNPGSAVVSLNWSRVYNDVNEDYSPGLGFSVRAVTPQDNQSVIFRLPKADNNYSYFTPDYVVGGTGTGDSTPINRLSPENRDERHSLIDFNNATFTHPATIEVGGDEGGNYFLVGNPLMAHLDMTQFFLNNPDLVQSYWIMDENKQIATVWDEKTGTYMSTDGEGNVGLIKPMQGFFVKSSSKTDKLNVKFTPDMITEPSTQDSGDEEPLGRGNSMSRLIIITAVDNKGEIASRALININPESKATYDTSEDASLLIDNTFNSRPTVYTVASGQALAINRLDNITETEVGLLASNDSTTRISFGGIDDLDNLMLLDTSTGVFTPLSEGTTVEVKGSAAGRLYITRKAADITEPTLAVVCNERTIDVVSTSEGITARAFTPAGIQLGNWKTDSNSLQFEVSPGIIIVEVSSNDCRVTRKFIVK